jgi:predicted branched-subunit amino acid permease
MARPPEPDAPRRARILRQALSVAFAVAPFGVVFGVACADAGLSWLDAAGFSTLTFAGSAQFAAVDVLGDGGTAAAAIGAGLLLNLRSLAFGVVLAPVLDGPWWKRAAMSQLVIDESTAVATAQDTPRWRRFGFLALLWPRLVGEGGADGRRIAAAGAVIAAVTIPFTPPGVPILAATLGVLAVRRSP